MNRLLILIVFFSVSLTGFSQERNTYTLSLEEAIQFALDSNYTAINARRDVAAAIKQKWETTATGLPQIDAAVSYQNNLKQQVTPLPAEIIGGEPGTFVPVTFSPKQNASVSATLNQLLFDGSYIVGLQAAKVFLDYSENAYEKTRLEVRKGVILAYGSVLLSQENVIILEKNRQTLEKNLNETQKVFENGLAEEEDVEQLQITLLEIETLLSNAMRMEVIAKETLNMALGIPIQTEVQLSDSLDQLVQKQIDLSFLDAEFGLEQNIDFRIAQNLIEQRNLELKLEKSRALPSISAFVNYSTNAFNNDFTFLDAEQDWYQSSLLGVNMNIPIISSGGRGSRTQRAKIALEQANTQFEQTMELLKLELNNARSDYQFSIEKYENSKKNLALSERVENKNQIKFIEGISSSFDLRQAQLQLYNAQQIYLQAMLEVISAKASLETILNTPNQK
jgi:outer membrane protein TolC